MSGYPRSLLNWAIGTLALVGIAGGLGISRPALAQQALQTLASVVTCSSTLPCSGGTNNSTGPGVQGISAKGKGVIGQTKFNATSTSNAQSGVLGQDLSTSGSFDYGVRGTSTRGIGVSGTSTSYFGVAGSSSTRAGVNGISSSGPGVIGTSTVADGVVGNSNTGSGSYGFSVSGGGVVGASSNNDGMDATTYNPSKSKTPRSGIFGYDASTDGGSLNNGVGGYSLNGVGVSGTSTNGTGVSAHGNPAFEAQGTNAGSFVMVGYDFSGNLIFDLDPSGNINISGQIYTGGSCNMGCAPKKASAGKRLVSYTPHESVPTMEDFGDAQLVNGRSSVRVDPAFVNGIDQRAGYQVFITPYGDNHGLYVTGRTLSGFSVRESQGGHSNLGFSYRIVAKPFGSSEPRLPMVEMKTMGRHALMPRATPR